MVQFTQGVGTNVYCEETLSFLFVHVFPGKEDPLHVGSLLLGNLSLLVPDVISKVSREKLTYIYPQKPPLLD